MFVIVERFGTFWQFSWQSYYYAPSQTYDEVGAVTKSSQKWNERRNFMYIVPAKMTELQMKKRKFLSFQV
ncbi:MAG: hypothetical protein LBN01_03635 [Endomicrobium sp.]|jgi:hypothetical protein|nr:hypothetical protein [Endomicrobium sp.]